MRNYHDIDRGILKVLPNPTRDAYEMKIFTPEFTFLGTDKQPDFSRVYVTFYPREKIIELKSLKKYF
jgi:7-cyano-7-deazaguanine reductase